MGKKRRRSRRKSNKGQQKLIDVEINDLPSGNVWLKLRSLGETPAEVIDQLQEIVGNRPIGFLGDLKTCALWDYLLKLKRAEDPDYDPQGMDFFVVSDPWIRLAGEYEELFAEIISHCLKKKYMPRGLTTDEETFVSIFAVARLLDPLWSLYYGEAISQHVEHEREVANNRCVYCLIADKERAWQYQKWLRADDLRLIINTTHNAFIEEIVASQEIAERIEHS
jgi:hypothetical protein